MNFTNHFTTAFYVPVINDLASIMHVIESSKIFNSTESGQLSTILSTTRWSIGIKKLYACLRMIEQVAPVDRVPKFVHSLIQDGLLTENEK